MSTNNYTISVTNKSYKEHSKAKPRKNRGQKGVDKVPNKKYKPNNRLDNKVHLIIEKESIKYILEL